MRKCTCLSNWILPILIYGLFMLDTEANYQQTEKTNQPKKKQNKPFVFGQKTNKNRNTAAEDTENKVYTENNREILPKGSIFDCACWPDYLLEQLSFESKLSCHAMLFLFGDVFLLDSI